MPATLLCHCLEAENKAEAKWKQPRQQATLREAGGRQRWLLDAGHTQFLASLPHAAKITSRNSRNIVDNVVCAAPIAPLHTRLPICSKARETRRPISGTRPWHSGYGRMPPLLLFVATCSPRMPPGGTRNLHTFHNTAGKKWPST